MLTLLIISIKVLKIYLSNINFKKVVDQTLFNFMFQSELNIYHH